MSIDRLQLEKPKFDVEQERQMQYAIYGRVGSIKFLQDAADIIWETGEYTKIEQAAWQIFTLSKMLDNPKKFTKYFENGKLERRLSHLKLILSNFRLNGNEWEMDPIFRQALAKNAGKPLLYDSNGDMDKLDSTFNVEVYPYFAGQLMNTLLEEDYLGSLCVNLANDLPLLQSNIEYYIGEYDPRR